MVPGELHFSLIQSEVHWEDPEKNLQMFGEKISKVPDSTEIILLPEMFSTGFSMNVMPLAETMKGPTIEWMQRTAENSGKVLCGSVIIKEEGKNFNRLIWMQPDGKFQYYDKRHLFRMADEDDYFSGGNKQLTIEYKGWKIRPLVCYDLRFPVWSRNRYEGNERSLSAEYDVLLYVANWPAVRVIAWDALLRARAVENQVYCLGLNRVGIDGTRKEYNGHSTAIDPKGNYISGPTDDAEQVINVKLSYEELAEFRKKFPQGLDADNFELLT